MNIAEWITCVSLVGVCVMSVLTIREHRRAARTWKTTDGRCTDTLSTDYGDRRCDLNAGHDGYHVRNDGYGRPEYHWGKP